MTMLVGDGLLPSNEGRGYVLRRIIRRAILAARRAGSDASLTEPLVDATIEKMGAAYPNLVDSATSLSRSSSAKRPGLRERSAPASRSSKKPSVKWWQRVGTSFLVTSPLSSTTRTAFRLS